MKRDMDLIRKMILQIEDSPTGRWPGNKGFEEYDPDQIGYHAYLIIDAGLATGIDMKRMNNTGPLYQLAHLTSSGHDFAEAARNEFIWNEVIGEMREKGIVSASVAVVKKILDKQIRKRLDAD